MSSHAPFHVAFLLAVALNLAHGTAQTPVAPLDSARAIRNLSAAEAERAHPVRLTATVTVQQADRTIFLQDTTGGTFIRARRDLPLVQSGQVVTVEGATAPGLYVPGIDAKNITVMGTADLPAPIPLTFEQLASGQFHYQWVEVSGIVRSVSPSDRGAIVTLALGDGRLELYFPATDNALPKLVDARVRAVGLAAGSINDRRQLVAPHLRMRAFGDLQVLEPAADDPFVIDTTPIQELLRFAPSGRAGHRVKVRGLVTHTDGEYVYLREGNQGLRVRGAIPAETKPGSDLEALGFPEMGRFTAFLTDAECRLAGQLEPPPPVDATPKEILAGTYDADLIRLEASLLEVVRTTEGQFLLMQADDALFSARIPWNEEITRTATSPGSRLRLTGVCSIALAELQPRGFRSSPRSFELLLRSAFDVEVVRAAPWWTQQRLTFATVTLLALALVALAWVALLRRQVRHQTALIEQKLQTETVVEERQRIAREFHDTLEQELVGLSLRLDALATKVNEGKARDLLDTARRLLQRLQNEAREFVWDLRRINADAVDLPAQIEHALTPITETGSVRLDVSTHGEVRRLPGTTEHNLVRIAQEAVTNSLKHGRARSVRIDLRFTASDVALSVQDDGAGFEPNAAQRAGHFGLVGIRERVRKLGGSCDFRSIPGAGTTILVTIPSEQPSH